MEPAALEGELDNTRKERTEGEFLRRPVMEELENKSKNQAWIRENHLLLRT